MRHNDAVEPSSAKKYQFPAQALRGLDQASLVALGFDAAESPKARQGQPLLCKKPAHKFFHIRSRNPPATAYAQTQTRRMQQQRAVVWPEASFEALYPGKQRRCGFVC